MTAMRKVVIQAICVGFLAHPGTLQAEMDAVSS